MEDKKPKKPKQTSKKVKIVGQKDFIDPVTNEVEHFQCIKMEERDFNFHKIWLQHIINSFELIGNTKTKLAFWILDHLDYENKLIYTYQRIHEETKISLETIRVTISTLIKTGFLQKINAGAYRVNPDYIFKGNHANRMNVLIQYSKTVEENKKEEEPKPLTANERLQKYLGLSQQNFEDKLNLEEMLELQEKLSKMIELKLKDNTKQSA